MILKPQFTLYTEQEMSDHIKSFDGRVEKDILLNNLLVCIYKLNSLKYINVFEKLDIHQYTLYALNIYFHKHILQEYGMYCIEDKVYLNMDRRMEPSGEIIINNFEKLGLVFRCISEGPDGKYIPILSGLIDSRCKQRDLYYIFDVDNVLLERLFHEQVNIRDNGTNNK